jgi:hypothetical protein
MKMAVAVGHLDHGFVERQGGWPMYTYLRSGGSRAEFRIGAIERSWRTYRRVARSGTESEIGGAGLMVLQRVFLALEDLGRLLHAFAAADPWVALRRARPDDVEDALAAALAAPQEAFERLGLLTPEQLAGERLPPAVAAAATRLRELVLRDGTAVLQDVEILWHTHLALARATMHGFPILAGEVITEPPGAGVVADGLSVPDARPFAAALVSTVAGREITTDRHIIHLDRDAVAAVRRSGIDGARLCGEVAGLKAESIRNGLGYTLPLAALERLTGPEHHALSALRSQSGV